MSKRFFLVLVVIGGQAVAEPHWTMSLRQNLGALYFQFAEPADEFKTSIGPRYENIKNYLAGWRRKIPFYGTASVPADINSAVSSIVTYRNHLNTLSKLGLNSAADDRFTEFLDDQSVWLSNHMGLLDSVGATELEGTRDFLRARLYQISLRTFRYFLEKEKALGKVPLHAVEIDVKNSLARLGAGLLQAASTANFDSDRLSDLWKPHSILPALTAVQDEKNLQRFAFIARRDRYQALGNTDPKVAQDEVSLAAIKSFWYVRERLAKVARPGEDAVRLAAQMDHLIDEAAKDSVDKVARKMARLRPEIETYVTHLSGDDLKPLVNAVLALKRLGPPEVTLDVESGR